MGEQIVDSVLVRCPEQSTTETEKVAAKMGQNAGEIWPDEPARAWQKDTDARWR